MAVWRHIPKDIYDALTTSLYYVTTTLRCAVWTKQWRYYYVLCRLRHCILCPAYEDPIFNSATGCDYLSMAGLKLIHVSKTGPWQSSEYIIAWTGNHISHNSVMCNYLFFSLIVHSWLTSYPNRHTWRNNNVIITSQQHRGVPFDVTITVALRPRIAGILPTVPCMFEPKLQPCDWIWSPIHARIKVNPY